MKKMKRKTIILKCWKLTRYMNNHSESFTEKRAPLHYGINM